MSLNMYLGEVHTQTQSMNAVCTATIQGMEQVIQSIDAFAIDIVLQGQTYSSAKSFFVQTFRPLAQGIIYLCEELTRQNDAFPNDFQSQVASTDVIEQEILEQIQGIDQTRANMAAISQTVPLPGTDAMMGIFDMMKRKLQEKLEHLHEFNYTSSSNYDTAIELASSISRGLAEVQSGKGFSFASGTFSTQELNMEWAASIQAIEEDRKRQADNSIEEGAMCGKLPPKSDFEKAWERDKKDLIDAWTGISTGFVDGAEDAWEGFVALGDKETWLNMRDAIVNYDETLPAMWNALSDSFVNDFWNGDMESRMHYAAYGVASLGLGFLGDKGLSKAGQVGKVAVVTGFTKGKSLITNSSAYRNALHILNNYEFKPGNHFAYTGVGSIRQYLQKAAPYTYEGPNGPETIKLRKGELAGESYSLKDAYQYMKDTGERLLGSGEKDIVKGTGNPPKITEIQEGDLGKHIIKGKNGRKELAPNVRYITEDGYKYTTDELGRIVDVEAGELILQKGKRNKGMQVAAGREDRLPDDDGGHLIGTQFHGSGDIDNLIAQNRQINRSDGEWYNMEQEWANALGGKPPKKVTVKIEPVYQGTSLRPNYFEIVYEIEGKGIFEKTIRNRAGG
ncbi:hypothetical protein D0U04_28220 [Bacillus clarus]|uniref:DNA/RNA non-specific endonuclease family protein n=1 Tax=Bacillus clarus TaxID=2338372 RepID=A0A090YX15_9BACI|nr:DNA/RNA non-specific endonuclease [Bacillus clarus]KFN02583.1 DNA/RNA non-specific endonuclease family protein [Bacillus clarus]RFT62390.1 hypothetical protein D0U04_28220 [Bacillus clarus]